MHLSAADAGEPLEPGDLERLAAAANLMGRGPASIDALARAHHAYRERGEPGRAVRCASWLALSLLLAGERARGNGWLARAERVLESAERDCPERGYVQLAIALRSLLEGDAGAAHRAFEQAAAIGERSGDPDLTTLARQGAGRALIRLGDTGQGVALLDEAMVAVTAGEASPMITGAVYCSVIDACLEIYDLSRAREWTAALNDWCASQEQLGPYRGQCLVHRAELMRIHGAWPEAMGEARRASEWLLRPPAHRAAGAAFYQLAELHRLRGDFERAEAAYRDASAWGREPQPGLALLRLGQGRVDAARAAIGRALEERAERGARAQLLPAAVEVLLAAGEHPAARTAADELARLAAELDASYLRVLAAQATGAVLLAEGHARDALVELRWSGSEWRALDAPYDAARGRVLIGLACRALGDEDAAALELDAALAVFRTLEAGPDIARVRALSRRAPPAAAGRLTARERQVLALVATGMTNRAISGALRISEKTVARHLSNIFTKLGLQNRAAATAYAYRHGIAAPPTASST